MGLCLGPVLMLGLGIMGLVLVVLVKFGIFLMDLIGVVVIIFMGNLGRLGFLV